MLDDAGLTKELALLGAPGSRDAADLAYARTLFARAIDTPGGLRIQTIHSFCASLLRRFPLEAGVSPVFREIDDRAARFLRPGNHRSNGNRQTCRSDSRTCRALHRRGFQQPWRLRRSATAHRRRLKKPDTEIWQQFGLPPGLDQAQILSQVFCGSEAALFAALNAALMQSGKVTDHKAAAKLARLNFLDPTVADLRALFSILLFGAKAKRPFGAKTDGFPTVGVRAAHPDMVAQLNDFMIRVEQARHQYTCLLAAEKTRAFLQFSPVFLTLYEASKADRGWLDFDDLIRRARGLLSDPAVAQWVLFRLDGGLDHVLVDEAQDTSPDQWKVIELLAQEFSVGIGARPDTRRTIFVVGDPETVDLFVSRRRSARF